ncbi:helix-turn-helix transcriptional regulator (plasmid) [Arthrobacter citreus]|nr:helix-turn-helix transcriptional regulator [Arthrobacter citreus]
MIEGKIIKFYRQLRNITQSELGEGICSTTHISKIERGITEVSDHTITLLAERLDINMQKEIQTYMSLDTLLKEWLQSIIMKITIKAERLKDQIEAIPLIKLSNFVQFYTLILAKYYLFTNNKKLVEKKLKKIDHFKNLSAFEENLHLHNKAIYELYFNRNFVEAISLLKDIKENDYNKEFHFELAHAYHWINSNVLAYKHAIKALQFFTETQCFSRVIATENLMLILISETDNSNISGDEYHRLIEMSLQYGQNDQIGISYHNFAYHKLREKRYMEASEYFMKASNLFDKETKPHYYLFSFEGYLNSMAKGKLLSNKELLTLVEEGLYIAQKSDAQMWIHIFTLHKFNLLNLKDEYFHYLETKLLPFFNVVGINEAIKQYQMKLFNYYLEKQDEKKANLLAQTIINKLQNYDHFV